MIGTSIEAWNSFVFHSEPGMYEKGSVKWAAASAKQFMGQVNSGGMNSFLTYSWELDPRDIAAALSVIGARHAAKQLEIVLDLLDRPLLPSSQDERWKIMEVYWKDELEEFENFSNEAETELMAALEAHVDAEQAFYLELGANRI